jgi:hypothetical protein
MPAMSGKNLRRGFRERGKTQLELEGEVNQ